MKEPTAEDIKEMQMGERKKMRRLYWSSKVLKILAWVYLAFGVMWGVIYLSNIPTPAPSFFAMVFTLLDSILPYLMAFAVLYGLSILIDFILGAIWVRLESLRLTALELFGAYTEGKTKGI